MQIANAAKSLIFNAEGKLLLLVRSATDERRPGEYDLPGGAVEPHEDIAAAASREIEEEVGLRISREELSLVYTGTRVDPKHPGESINRFVFLASVTSPNITLSFEHSEYEWMDLDRAMATFDHSFYVPAIQYLRDHGMLPVR